jgi:endonuclease/exonuclease/phosphatase family metal-dependent hydrolase
MVISLRVNQTFSAVTYNVLAQSYIRGDHYPRSPPEALEPSRRHALLLARIGELDADLLCLQELEPAVYDALRTRLGATHHAAYAQRRERPDGAAIFARRSRFGWAGHDVLRYRAHRPATDDLALVAALTTGRESLHVVSTHLTWQPEWTPPAEHLGRRQMLELLAFRDASARAEIWIFAGDFNAISQSAVLTVAQERGMDESCRCQRPWDTTAINGRPRKIDYLLFSTGRLTPRPGTLPKLQRDSVLPSLTEPSDHLPLRVDFAPCSSMAT